MLKEFFFKGRVCAIAAAWAGLLLVSAHSVFNAWLKFRLNKWYSEFYDALQEGTSQLSNSTISTHDVLREERARISNLLWDFVFIVLPTVVVHPASRWIRSLWSFRWRMNLIKAYTFSWDPNAEPVEGASQRLHEDTQRFSRGLEVCISTVLDSICTLAVFTPILVGLGEKVKCPLPNVEAGLGGWWLFATASLSALFGLGVAVVAGSHLVLLEVRNQKVEARFRKDLVILETNPSVLCGVTTVDGTPFVLAPSPVFVETWSLLSANYGSLFRNFFYLNTWLVSFDQVMSVLPYLIAAPLIFAASPQERISLGTLVQMSNSFDKVFSSFSVISESWGEVNAFRSVIRRLSEFERRLYGLREDSTGVCLVSPLSERSDGARTARRSSHSTCCVPCAGTGEDVAEEAHATVEQCVEMQDVVPGIVLERHGEAHADPERVEVVVGIPPIPPYRA